MGPRNYTAAGSEEVKFKIETEVIVKVKVKVRVRGTWAACLVHPPTILEMIPDLLAATKSEVLPRETGMRGGDRCGWQV